MSKKEIKNLAIYIGKGLSPKKNQEILENVSRITGFKIDDENRITEYTCYIWVNPLNCYKDLVVCADNNHDKLNEISYKEFLEKYDTQHQLKGITVLINGGKEEVSFLKDFAEKNKWDFDCIDHEHIIRNTDKQFHIYFLDDCFECQWDKSYDNSYPQYSILTLIEFKKEYCSSETIQKHSKKTIENLLKLGVRYTSEFEKEKFVEFLEKHDICTYSIAENSIFVVGNVLTPNKHISIDEFFKKLNNPAPKMPKINGCDGIYDKENNLIVYGCAKIDYGMLTNAFFPYSTSCENGANRSIKEITLDSGVKITKEQFAQIKDCVEWCSIKPFKDYGC